MRLVSLITPQKFWFWLRHRFIILKNVYAYQNKRFLCSYILFEPCLYTRFFNCWSLKVCFLCLCIWIKSWTITYDNLLWIVIPIFCILSTLVLHIYLCVCVCPVYISIIITTIWIHCNIERNGCGYVSNVRYMRECVSNGICYRNEYNFTEIFLTKL